MTPLTICALGALPLLFLVGWLVWQTRIHGEVNLYKDEKK